MSDQLLPTDWVRAAKLAHKLLSQTISDEELDELTTRAVATTAPLGVAEAA